MDINWKEVAQSPGYKSLKAAYVHDVQNAEAHRRRFKSKPMRDKAEFLELFNWVINRAKHYAHRHRVTLDVILNKWEEGRNGSWWLNSYQDCQQPKAYSYITRRRDIGIRGHKKYWKRQYGHRKDAEVNGMVCREIMRFDRFNQEKKDKPRWTMKRKRHVHRFKNL